MLRLHAPVQSPYRLAVKAAPSDTVALTLTAPDATTVAVALALNGDTHSATWTPDQTGTWTAEVTTTDDAVNLLGQTFAIDVATHAPGAFVYDPSDLDPATGVPTGHRLRWPCPNLRVLPCIHAWTPAAVGYWLNLATDTLHDDTCRRFPGVQNYARLRPRASSACLCRVGDTWGIDLWWAVRYPVLELVDVEVDGASVGTSGWRIEGMRYLVPNVGTLWPNQDPWAAAGEADTWSITVRYGRVAPPMAVTARDRFAYSMLVDNEPTSGGHMACALPPGTTALSENGRTIQIDPNHNQASAALLEEARRRWRCRARGPRLLDPTDHPEQAVQVVTGDPTPEYSHAAFLASGCDLEAILASLTA